MLKAWTGVKLCKFGRIRQNKTQKCESGIRNMLFLKRSTCLGMSTINSKLIWCLETLCLRERSRSSESKFYWELFKLPQHHPPSFRNSDAKQAQLFPFQTLQQVDCFTLVTVLCYTIVICLYSVTFKKQVSTVKMTDAFKHDLYSKKLRLWGLKRAQTLKTGPEETLVNKNVIC